MCELMGSRNQKSFLKWYYDQIFALDVLGVLHKRIFHERIKMPFTVCKYLF